MSLCLDVTGSRCHWWPFATCATRYLPYGHLPTVVQADLGVPGWAIDISNIDISLCHLPRFRGFHPLHCFNNSFLVHVNDDQKEYEEGTAVDRGPVYPRRNDG